MHCDQHVGKMLIESCQMLSTVRLNHGLGAPYKRTHTNHKCTKWVRRSLQNYLWLVELGQQLFCQHLIRYGTVHGSGEAMDWLAAHRPPSLPSKGLTPFALAMPLQYFRRDRVAAYRGFYKAEKTFATWAKGIPAPDWME